MKFEDLSAADQKLLNTDLGDFEKDAAEQVATADEMYSVGFNKLATETADELDALMASEKNAAEEVSLEEGSEKIASDLSAFIERGFFDGLCKLGSDRHGDPYIYIYPYIEEKVAEAGAKGAVRKFYEAVKGHAGKGAEKVKGFAAKGVKKVKEHHAQSAADVASGTRGVFGKGYTAKSRLHDAATAGKGALGLAPAGVGAGLAAYGAKKALGKKKEG